MGGRIKSHMHKSKGNTKKSIGSQIEQENQSHHIPNELIFDILPRLTVKSLVRFKCVNKPWCSFISQLKRGKQKLLFSTKHCIHSVDLEAPNIVSQPLYFPFLLESFEIIGCCNGLLCVVMREEGAVVLCNRLTRTYRSILLSEDNPVSYYYDGFGFGYDQLTDDYKILTLQLHGGSPQLHIYSLNTDSWKFKKFTLPSAQNLYISRSAAFVKEAFYWGLQCTNRQCTNIVVRYDLIDENIRLIQLPDNIGMTDDSFHLRDFRGSLSMIHYHYRSLDCIIDIWALEEDKWIKLISIPHPEEVRLEEVWFGHEVPVFRDYLKPVCLTKDGQVLMKFDSYLNLYHGRNVFFFFSPEEKKFRKFETGDIDIRYAEFHPGIIYTETLVSPFRSNQTSGKLFNSCAIYWDNLPWDNLHL